MIFLTYEDPYHIFISRMIISKTIYYITSIIAKIGQNSSKIFIFVKNQQGAPLYLSQQRKSPIPHQSTGPKSSFSFTKSFPKLHKVYILLTAIFYTLIIKIQFLR